MYSNDGRGVEPDRLAEQLAHPHDGRVQGADVLGVHLQDVVLAVQDHDPKLFLFQRPHLSQQQARHVCGRLDLQPVGAGSHNRSAAQFQRGGELRGSAAARCRGSDLSTR